MKPVLKQRDQRQRREEQGAGDIERTVVAAGGAGETQRAGADAEADEPDRGREREPDRDEIAAV